MKFGIAALAFVVVCSGILVTACSQAADSSSVRGRASPPPAFANFCKEFPADCQPRNASAGRMTLTAERMNELKRANATVNRSVREISDRRLYGTEDRWTLPLNGRGDCEDFALMKRHQLMALGWPSSVLLVTVVRDRRGSGHAVLTVLTDEGDYILDNQNWAVRLWWTTGYTFFTRQSSSDPRQWVALGTGQGASRTVATTRERFWGGPTKP